MDDLVTATWLAEHRAAQDVVAVDCTTFMPGSDRDAHAEFLAGHIQGARFFDIEALFDNSVFEHPTPPAYYNQRE